MRSFRLRSFCLFSNQVSRQAVRQFTSRDTTVRGTFRWMAAYQERLPVPQGIVKQLFFFKRYFHPALPSDRWIARISSRLQRATIPFFLSSLLSRVVFLLLFDDRFQFSSLGCCPSRILECFCVVLLWEWGAQKVMAGGGVTWKLRLDKIKKTR